MVCSTLTFQSRKSCIVIAHNKQSLLYCLVYYCLLLPTWVYTTQRVTAKRLHTLYFIQPAGHYMLWNQYHVCELLGILHLEPTTSTKATSPCGDVHKLPSEKVWPSTSNSYSPFRSTSATWLRSGKSFLLQLHCYHAFILGIHTRIIRCKTPNMCNRWRKIPGTWPTWMQGAYCKSE